MTTPYNNLADFSSEGFNIGKDAKVLTYLHGLSDFWVYMFDDASKVNLMLEANSVSASDIYNKFLQLTSVLSLEGISTLTNSQIKLVLISEDDAVAGMIETYKFPQGIDLKYARCLVNRAFLPTTTLENEADYYIDEALGQISFAQPLSSLGFPFRTLSTGKKQYAVWAIDAKLDDQLIYDYYAKLISINPTSSTDLFKNFVYGMYYLFVQGPHLDTVKKGLNIALGIPLARDTESVLEIRKYPNTDQWLVITDLNSYLVPYGLSPTVKVDDVLTSGQELASWVEVKDFENDGEWWVNYMLPAHLMPHIPPSVPGGGGIVADASPDRYMTPGSYSDWLMRNFLKTHTFLVNIKTVNFKNLQNFEQLAQIIHDVKPSYTVPIYVWTVPVMDEILELIDTLTYEYHHHICETVTDGISRFNRNSSNPHLREICPQFTRMSVPASVDTQSGYSPEINGTPQQYQGGVITGFIAPQYSYRALSDSEAGWDTALRNRGNNQYLIRRGRLDFNRARPSTGAGITAHPFQVQYPGYRMVALYTTTLTDVKEKFDSCNQPLPNTYLMPLLQPNTVIDATNAHAIDDWYQDDYYDILIANFDYLFQKGVHGRYLGPTFPAASQFSWRPDIGQVTNLDFLIFSRITDTHCGAYWMTQNFDVETPPYIRHEEPDVLTIQTTGIPNRGGALMGSPYFMTRSAGMSISYNTDNAINDQPINEGVDVTATISVIYSDQFNAPFQKDRSGRTLVAKRVFK